MIGNGLTLGSMNLFFDLKNETQIRSIIGSSFDRLGNFTNRFLNNSHRLALHFAYFKATLTLLYEAACIS